MFIPRRYSNKKSLDNENIPFPLYVNGLAGMILNDMPDQRMQAASLCRHLREVAEDAVERPWQVVRKWSKSTFDRIDRSEICWEDYGDSEGQDDE